MTSLTKTALVEAMAQEAGVTVAQSHRLLESFIKVVGASLTAGRPVRIKGFARLDTIVRNPRTSRNPRTNVQIEVPSTRVVTFRPCAQLKLSVKNSQPTPTPVAQD